MAGTVTTTEIVYTTIKKITFNWIAAGGAADGVTTTPITGMLQRVVFDYGDADNLYDVVVLDSDGTDILHGNGANLPQADTLKSYADGLGCVVNSVLTLGVTNAGGVHVGAVHLYFQG